MTNPPETKKRTEVQSLDSSEEGEGAVEQANDLRVEDNEAAEDVDHA